MKTIKLEKISEKAFAPYGEFYTITKPSGHSLDGAIHSFYPDRVVGYFDKPVGFSPLVVKKPNELKITAVEYHTTTNEVIIPLDDDMILHVAEPSGGVPITDKTKAFLVPKNTVVKLKACIWHLAPLPYKKDKLTALIVLPECTYINDCKVVELTPEEQFVIEK